MKPIEYGKVIKRVFEEIDKKEEELIGTIQGLVKIPSLVGQELEAQKFMESRYREARLRIDTFEAKLDDIKKHKAYINIPLQYENRPNVVGVLEGAEHPSLILNGHIDVVSPEPLSQWNTDPWGGRVMDGKLYGRGAFDMKGGLVANLFALKAVLDSGIKPRGKVILESVIEEESGGSGGTLACFLRGYRGDGMIIPEPSKMYVVIAHNGIKYFRIHAVGKTAHAALSHTGVNVIGKMNKIYDECSLQELDEKINLILQGKIMGRILVNPND